jgi:hypothetical protein
MRSPLRTYLSACVWGICAVLRVRSRLAVQTAMCLAYAWQPLSTCVLLKHHGEIGHVAWVCTGQVERHVAANAVGPDARVVEAHAVGSDAVVPEQPKILSRRARTLEDDGDAQHWRVGSRILNDAVKRVCKGRDWVFEDPNGLVDLGRVAVLDAQLFVQVDALVDHSTAGTNTLQMVHVCPIGDAAVAICHSVKVGAGGYLSKHKTRQPLR